MTAIFAAIIGMLCICLWLKVPQKDAGLFIGGVIIFAVIIAALHVGIIGAAIIFAPESQAHWQIAGR